MTQDVDVSVFGPASQPVAATGPTILMDCDRNLNFSPFRLVNRWEEWEPADRIAGGAGLVNGLLRDHRQALIIGGKSAGWVKPKSSRASALRKSSVLDLPNVETIRLPQVYTSAKAPLAKSSQSRAPMSSTSHQAVRSMGDDNEAD
jgi:hypothetical protein